MTQTASSLAPAAPAPMPAGQPLTTDGRPFDADLMEIERKFLDFARLLAPGEDKAAAMRAGRFASHVGGAEPDLFGAIDVAYSAHILGLLDGMSDAAGRRDWALSILAAQDGDGWFRAHDKQSHGVEHATAYALGALAILVGHDPAVWGRLKPFAGLKAQIAPRPDADTAPFALSFMDKLHFWRGSHRAGGLPSIVAAVHRAGLDTQALLGLPDAQAWLDGYWAWFARRLDPASGYWRMAPWPARFAFGLAYRSRHHPETAAMGGAVHLYWVSERLGKPFPHPRATVQATSRLLRANGLFENEPYCIDLDGAFMIGRPMEDLPANDPALATGRKTLAANRKAVVDWYLQRDVTAWNPGAHRHPGAFAAVAECDRALLPASARRWKDVFETTWWL